MQKARELWEGLKTGWYLGTMFAGIDWPPWRRWRWSRSIMRTTNVEIYVGDKKIEGLEDIEIKIFCAHVPHPGGLFMSNPPQARCIKCGELYTIRQ